MLRNVRKGSLAAVERSSARLGIVRSALEPDVKSTDRLWLKWARTGPMHCSADQQNIDNSFGWRIEEIVRERQHQPRLDRAADHRWRLVSSSCQPGPQIFHHELQGTVWRNLSLSERRRPSTTEPLRTLRDTSCPSFCARPTLYGVCASLTSLLARGFRPRRPSPRPARPVTLRLPMSPPPWPRRHASASAKCTMLPFWSRTHRLSRFQTKLSTRWSAISG